MKTARGEEQSAKDFCRSQSFLPDVRWDHAAYAPDNTQVDLAALLPNSHHFKRSTFEYKSIPPSNSLARLLVSIAKNPKIPTHPRKAICGVI
eukprot:6466866-Amphidinium_carterae.2